MKFWKMNGAGNDFLIINNIEEKLPEEAFPAIAAKLCERHLSIGADGIMVVERPTEGTDADIRMLFYNSDGTVGEMCGNGARCICRYVYENGLARDTSRQVIETMSGIVTGEHTDGRMFRIRLNDPTIMEPDKELVLTAEDLPFETGEVTGDLAIPCAYVELGSPGLPHLVVEYTGVAADLCRPASGSPHLKDADDTRLRELGRALRWHKDLPKGANVNFYELTKGNEAYERTFERGVEDFTYACGTGTGSVVAILALQQALGFEKAASLPVQVKDGMKLAMYGGELSVEIGEVDLPIIRGIYLTGPTNIVATGEVRDEELPAALRF